MSEVSVTERDPRAVLRQFESLGDNCEFGLMQRHFGVEGIGLLRWGSIQSGFTGLLTALTRRFEGCGEAVELHSQADEYISRDLVYGIVFHTDKMLGSIDPERLVRNEKSRIPYLARNLVENIASATRIFVYKASAGIGEQDIRHLHALLRSIGAVCLLWVVEADQLEVVGTVERIGAGLLKGYIDRFSPVEHVISRCSFDVWLQICQNAAMVAGQGLEITAMAQTLPPTVEPYVYRALWPDLADLGDAEAIGHYERYGADEGRQPNQLATRADFVALIPHAASALEIGPFCRPLLNGPHTEFFDVLTQEQLRERARLVGSPDAQAPYIHYVSPVGDLRIIERTFDCVLSSHCLEHQPDLIAHLQQVSRILQPGGRYFLLVPDKRYCFDAFIAESTIADVLDAHDTARQVHTLRSVIEHRALTTHNDVDRHWDGDHGALEDGPRRLLSAIQEYHAANGGYVDVHAWYFTPRSAAAMISTLREAAFIDLAVERLYSTRKGSNEFWMVLQKPERAPTT